MATVTSPFPISGSLGDLTFSNHNGKTILRHKPGITREKFLTHPKLQRSRENAQSFGGASKIACAIYSSLRGNQRKILAPYAHNKLIARIQKGMRRRDRLVEDIRFTDIAHLLRDIDLSRDRQVSKRIQATTLGPNHCPETLILNGIHEAASLVQCRSHHRIEFRFELKYIAVPEVTHDDKWQYQRGDKFHLTTTSTKTDWIPVEILPQEPLKLSLHHAQKLQPTGANAYQHCQRPLHQATFIFNPSSFINIPNPFHPLTSQNHPTPPSSQSCPIFPHQNQHPNDFPPSPDSHRDSIFHQNQPQLDPHPHPSSLISHQNQHQDPSGPHLVFLLLEWRQIQETEDGEEIAISLKDKTVAKVVALQMDEQTAQLLARLPEPPKPRQPKPINTEWRDNPEAFLAQNLARFQSPPPT